LFTAGDTFPHNCSIILSGAGLNAAFDGTRSLRHESQVRHGFQPPSPLHCPHSGFVLFVILQSPQRDVALRRPGRRWGFPLMNAYDVIGISPTGEFRVRADADLGGSAIRTKSMRNSCRATDETFHRDPTCRTPHKRGARCGAALQHAPALRQKSQQNRSARCRWVAHFVRYVRQTGEIPTSCL
jgi:hypothetical protein